MKEGWLSISIIAFMVTFSCYLFAETIYFSGKIGEEDKWEEFTLWESQEGKTSEQKIKIKVCRSEIADFGDYAAVYVEWQVYNTGPAPLQPQWKDKYLAMTPNSIFPLAIVNAVNPVDGARGRTLQPGETSQVLKLKYLITSRESHSMIFYWGSYRNEKGKNAFPLLIHLNPKKSGSQSPQPRSY